MAAETGTADRLSNPNPAALFGGKAGRSQGVEPFDTLRVELNPPGSEMPRGPPGVTVNRGALGRISVLVRLSNTEINRPPKSGRIVRRSQSFPVGPF